MHPPGHLTFFSRRTLERLLNRAGFEVERIVADGRISDRPVLADARAQAAVGALGFGNVMTVYARRAQAPRPRPLRSHVPAAVRRRAWSPAPGASRSTTRRGSRSPSAARTRRSSTRRCGASSRSRRRRVPGRELPRRADDRGAGRLPAPGAAAPPRPRPLPHVDVPVRLWRPDRRRRATADDCTASTPTPARRRRASPATRSRRPRRRRAGRTATRRPRRCSTSRTASRRFAAASARATGRRSRRRTQGRRPRASPTSADDYRSYFAVYEDSLRRWGEAASPRYPWTLFERAWQLAERHPERAPAVAGRARGRDRGGRAGPLLERPRHVLAGGDARAGVRAAAGQPRARERDRGRVRARLPLVRLRLQRRPRGTGGVQAALRCDRAAARAARVRHAGRCGSPAPSGGAWVGRDGACLADSLCAAGARPASGGSSSASCAGAFRRSAWSRAWTSSTRSG